MLKKIMARNTTVGGYIKLLGIVAVLMSIVELIYFMYTGLINPKAIANKLKSKFSNKKSD